jgi:hypothetical protein
VKPVKECIMNPLKRSASDLTNLDGRKAGNVSLDWTLINLDRLRCSIVPSSCSALAWRQLDKPFRLEAQKESTANHVFELTIGLSPVPGLADSARKSGPMVFRAALNEMPDELDIPCGKGATSVDENRSHASMD